MNYGRKGNDDYSGEIMFESIKYMGKINKDLEKYGIANLNNFILKNSLSLRNNSVNVDNIYIDNMLMQIYHYLIEHSKTYQYLFDEREKSDIFLFINQYIQKVFHYYNRIMLTDYHKFDSYVDIIDKMPSDKKFKNENLAMTVEDIQRTMHLLNESVRKYYEIYNNKKLISTYSNNKIIEFRIKEAELAHLLGVKLISIVNDPICVDIFRITPNEIKAINDYNFDPLGSAAIDVLHKIIDMKSGNLLEVEEDRIKKFRKKDYFFPESDAGTKDTLMKYSKINIRTKAFIDFKPYEEVSMTLDFPIGYKLIKQSKQTDSQHSLLISRNSLSDDFKYSTLVTNYDFNDSRRYFQSLLIKKPEEYSELQQDGTPAVSLKVALVKDNSGNDGSGDDGGVTREFTSQEIANFLQEVRANFTMVDFSNLYGYFQGGRVL